MKQNKTKQKNHLVFVSPRNPGYPPSKTESELEFSDTKVSRANQTAENTQNPLQILQMESVDVSN